MPHRVRVGRETGSFEGGIRGGVARGEESGRFDEEVAGGVQGVVLCTVGGVCIRLCDEERVRNWEVEGSGVTGRTLKLAIALLLPFIVGPSTPLIAIMIPTKNAGTSARG
jgi:hypothetical protein